MGNQIQCCEPCHSSRGAAGTERVSLRGNDIIDASAGLIPTSSPSKARGVGGPRLSVASTATPATASSFGPGRFGVDGYRDPASERERLRSQLKAFVEDATDTVPVTFVDVTTGATQVGCYTLDRGLQEVTLEAGQDTLSVPVRHVLEVYKPEDCLAWAQAGHEWPQSRLRRLVIASVLTTEGEQQIRGWLEADEARRNRCVVCLSILATPPAEDPAALPPSSNDAAAGRARRDSRSSGRLSGGFATNSGGAALPVASGGVAVDAGGTGGAVGGGAGRFSGATEGVAGRGAAGHGQQDQRRHSSGFDHSGSDDPGTAPPRGRGPQTAESRVVGSRAGTNEAAAVDELRLMARQFAQEATDGVEGAVWVEAATGERTPCHYRLDPALRELHFCPGALPLPREAPQTPEPSGSGAPAGEAPSSAAGSSAASSSSHRRRAPRDGKGVAGGEAASGSTTASSWRTAPPPGDAGSLAANHVSLAEASAAVAGAEASAASTPVPAPLCRVSLAGVQDVYRPEERPDFGKAHAWYMQLAREDRERLVCVRHRPSRPEPPAGEAGQGVAPASETAVLLERTALAREKFVVCAKVLHLSVV